jgi:hypothetical protein
MKTKYSIRLIILLTVIGIFISGFVTIGIFVLIKTNATSLNFMGLLTVSLFIWIGMSYIALMIGKIKKLEFQNGNLIIRKPFLNRIAIIELSRIKYHEFEWEMSWQTMKGILIKLDNGDIEKIGSKEYKNSDDFISLITKSCEKDDTLKPKLWTKEIKVIMITGMIIILGFIVLKFTS